MCVAGCNITFNGTVVDVAGNSVRVLLQHGTWVHATVMIKHTTLPESKNKRKK